MTLNLVSVWASYFLSGLVKACHAWVTGAFWRQTLKRASFLSQVSDLSPALTATRSSGRRVTGKHTSRLTSRICSRRNTSFLERATKPNCPRVTCLYLTYPCKSPSSLQTLVGAHDKYMRLINHESNICDEQKECVPASLWSFFLRARLFPLTMFISYLFTFLLIGLIPSQNPRLAFQQYLEVVGNDRPYKCQYCSKAYKKSSHLKQHVR